MNIKKTQPGGAPGPNGPCKPQPSQPQERTYPVRQKRVNPRRQEISLRHHATWALPRPAPGNSRQNDALGQDRGQARRAGAGEREAARGAPMTGAAHRAPVAGADRPSRLVPRRSRPSRCGLSASPRIGAAGGLLALVQTPRRVCPGPTVGWIVQELPHVRQERLRIGIPRPTGAQRVICYTSFYLGVSGEITSHTGPLHHYGGRYYYRRRPIHPDEPLHDLTGYLPVLIKDIEIWPRVPPRPLLTLRRAE